MSARGLGNSGTGAARSDEPCSLVLPIEARGIGWNRDGRAILRSVDLTVAHASGLTVLLGPNGAGKSLLMRIMAGLVQPDTGLVTWRGLPADDQRTRHIGFIFQRPVVLRRSALSNITFALSVTRPSLDTEARRTLADRALAVAGLSHLANIDASLLSGGEQQRLALARALACEPDLLILDEPASNLDPASTAAIETQLKAVRDSGVPIVLITHDLAQARRLADHVVFMHLGQIKEQTPASTFFDAPRSLEAAAFVRGDIVV